MYNCLQCKVLFKKNIHNKKICSPECKKLFYDRESAYEDLSHGSVGSISEMRVCCEMLKRGYSVFRSVSPSSFCDVIAIKNKECLMIEVRTGYVDTTGKLSYSKVLHDKVSTPTHYGVFIPKKDIFDLIEISEEDKKKWSETLRNK